MKISVCSQYVGSHVIPEGRHFYVNVYSYDFETIGKPFTGTIGAVPRRKFPDLDTAIRTREVEYYINTICIEE